MWNTKYLRTILFLLGLFLGVGAIAHQSDSVPEYHPYELILKLDNRRTHLNGDFTAIYGIVAGLSIHHRTRIKLGVNGTIFHAGRADEGKARNDVSRLLYYSLGSEYDLIDLEKITIIPFAKIGLGRHYYQLYDQNETKLEDYSEKIIPLEAGLYVSDHLTPWLDLKIGGGWRWVMQSTSGRLSNYFLKLGLGLHLKKLEYHRKRRS